jgi:hypothetical protein
VLARVPDAEGLAAWHWIAQNGSSHAALADGFLGSLEADRNLVDQYYAVYLARAGEPDGVGAWTEALQSGRLSRAKVAQAFLASDEFFARAAAGGI